MNRRTFTKNAMGTLLSYFFFKSLYASQAFSRRIRPLTNRWIRDLQEVCLDLKQTRIAKAGDCSSISDERDNILPSGKWFANFSGL